MKTLIAMLVLFLGLLQYQLWFAHGGLLFAYRLHHSLTVQHQQNALLSARNEALAATIDDLKNGNDVIEEHARYDLGMLKPNEVFYQLAPAAK
jgi:cell division protein FtsB